jgi:hypothetical protein
MVTNALCYPEFGGFGGFATLISALPFHGSKSSSEVVVLPIWQNRPWRVKERPILDSGPIKDNTTPVASHRTPQHSLKLLKCRCNWGHGEPLHFA